MRKFLLLAVTSLTMTAALPADEPIEPRSVRPTAGPGPVAAIVGTPLPTGMSITPTAAPGSSVMTLNPGLAGTANYLAGQPVSTVTSPDGNTLLVLTSGYNLVNGPDGKVIPASSNEYVFVYDISKNAPVQTQVLQVPNTYCGIAWNPSGKEFYVSGGQDDTIHVFGIQGTAWSEVTAIALGHAKKAGLGLAQGTVAAGLGVNLAGTMAVVANWQNDSISVIDLQARSVRAEVDLRPGVADPGKAGVAGGEYPFWVSIVGNKAYVSSQRDREIVVLDLSQTTPAVTKRIALQGNPNKMIVNPIRNVLLAAVDNQDAVVAIDTTLDIVLDTIYTTAPNTEPALNTYFLKGSNPNGLALSPDGRTLYVTNGGTNSVAVIALNTYRSPSYVTGLIPTGWYPESVSVSRDGSMLYVAYGKSVPGPDRGACLLTLVIDDPTCDANNQYILQIQKGALNVIPTPNLKTLEGLTQQVAANSNFNTDPNHDANQNVMAQIRQNVKHVIYIIKENRTYDQVLGDLERGNGDPSINLFPEALTPNQHQIARQFTVLDNFYDTGEVSGVGWNWTTAGRTQDIAEKYQAPSYAGRISNYDYEGTNRNLNVGIANLADRIAANPVTPNDPNLLPGAVDADSPDGPFGEAGAGYLWDAALRSGLTIRNYGVFADLTRYSLPDSTGLSIPLSPTPFASKTVQTWATKASLQPYTDVYFRGYDNKYPDYWRFQEWSREFDQYVANNNLPSLEFVRFMHDHTGTFTTAAAGVNTIESQVADNDYAVGLLIDKISSSPYKNNTLVFVIEDDAQDGPDHVDAHRSIALVAGPYVKQNALVSTRYNTTNFVRTIKDVLGIPYYGLFDGTAEPMADIFDPSNPIWNYKSRLPAILKTTMLSLPAGANDPAETAHRPYPKPRHNAHYWSKKMEGQDFEVEDHLDTNRYNLALWQGLKGKNVPYPAVRDGRDLRNNRESLLKQQASFSR